MNSQIGDIISMNRVTSWTYDSEIADAVYDGVESVKLILRRANVRGLNIIDISSFPEEAEILLAPCDLYVQDRKGDLLEVSYVNNVVNDEA